MASEYVYVILFKDYTGQDHYIGVTKTRKRAWKLLAKEMDEDFDISESDKYIHRTRLL